MDTPREGNISRLGSSLKHTRSISNVLMNDLTIKGKLCFLIDDQKQNRFNIH